MTRPRLAVLLTATLATAAVGLLGTPAAGHATTERPQAPPRTTAGHHLDTSSKQKVRRAYRKNWVPSQKVASGWTGSAAGCVAGAPSAAAQKATLRSVNFARALAGLDKVTFSDDLDAQAQQAALMMAANGALSHDPPSTWPCWTQVGHDAAGSSNLAFSAPTLTAGGAVSLYMGDGGSGNEAAGHRRWILYPSASVMGNGLTSTTDALYVFGPRNDAATDPDWVSWPTAGWFPKQLEPDGRWSLSSGDPDADFSHATVSVRRGGKTLTATPYPVANGYGMPTLVFAVSGADRPGIYQVVVRGIDGAAAPRHRWTVRLFKA